MEITSLGSDRAEGAAFGPPLQSRPPAPVRPSGSGPAFASDDSGQSSIMLPAQSPLRLREGTELLGRYQGSAYEHPTYLVRRDDNQVIHISHLLYLVLLLIDGHRELSEITDELTTELGRQVVPANVEYLIDQKLRPLGLMASGIGDDREEALTRSKPLLALRYRTRVIPPQMHRGITTVLQPLFWPPIVLLVLGGLLAVNIWLFGTQGGPLAHAARTLPFHPNLFLLVTVLVLFSGFFHELGHATATRYSGGSPGVMGVGIYLAWPAFYTDLTDSYRLDRRGRLRCDLGGVYFNGVLVVVAGAVYFATGFAPLAIFAVVSQAMALYQFLPFIRMDGYYIMSDLVGVPNLFVYLGPVLLSLVRRHDPANAARLRHLKPQARRAIKVWSVVTVAFLAFNFGFIAILAPVILPSEWAAIHLQGQAIVAAFSHNDLAGGVNDVIDLVFLAVAPLGMLLIAGILLRRVLGAIRRWWPTHPKVAAALALVVAGVVLFQGQALVSRLDASPAPSGPSAVATKGAPSTAPLVPTRRFPDRAVVPQVPAPSVALAAAQSPPDQVYVVQPGDSLWGIAAMCLGDPDRWKAIFALNAGVPQPDGRTLVDPDLIYPGWRLDLPGDQAVAAVIPEPGPPDAQTDTATAGSVVRSTELTGLDVHAVGGTPPLPPTAGAAGPLPPGPSAGGQTTSSAGGSGTSSTRAGGSSGGTSVIPAARQPSPSSQGSVGQPTRPQPATAPSQPARQPPSRRITLSTVPDSSPPTSLPPNWHSGSGEAVGRTVSVPVALGVPDERSPPDIDGW